MEEDNDTNIDIDSKSGDKPILDTHVSTFQNSEWNVFHGSIFLLAAMILYGLIRVYFVLHENSSYDADSKHLSTAHHWEFDLLGYLEVILISLSTVAPMVVVALFSFSKTFRVCTIPFVTPLCITEIIYWALRYLEMSGGIVQRYNTWCLYFAVATNTFAAAATLWVSIVAVYMYIAVRWSSASLRLSTYLVVHVAVWVVCLVLVYPVAEPYLRGKEQVRMHARNVGFCMLPRAYNMNNFFTPCAGIVVNIVVVCLLRSRIASTYPNQAKKRMHQLTNRLLACSLLTRVPAVIGACAETFDGLKQYQWLMYLNVILHHVGGTCYVCVIIFDYWQRKRLGITDGKLLTINAPSISNKVQVPTVIPGYLAKFTQFSAIWKGKVQVTLRSYCLENEHDEIMDRVKQEAMLVSKLHHKNILQTYAIYSLGNTINVVSESIAGTSLQEAIINSALPISYNNILSWGIQISKAILHMHNAQPAITHRNLNPAVIVVQNSNHIKLVEFNMARTMATDKKHNTVTTAAENALWHLEASNYCLAPELMLDEECYDTKVDAYSFGMLLWQLCTRNLYPYDYSYIESGNIVTAILKDEIHPKMPEYIPQTLTKLIGKCLQMNPSKRPKFNVILDILESEYFKRCTFSAIDRRVCETIE